MLRRVRHWHRPRPLTRGQFTDAAAQAREATGSVLLSGLPERLYEIYLKERADEEKGR